jgi:hypothetical protein
VNPPPPDCTVEDIARELEHYISLHPTAADTVGGIARWWLTLLEQPALDRVEAAVDVLVSRGLLNRHRLPDGNLIYACATRAPTQ